MKEEITIQVAGVARQGKGYAAEVTGISEGYGFEREFLAPVSRDDDEATYELEAGKVYEIKECNRANGSAATIEYRRYKEGSGRFAGRLVQDNDLYEASEVRAYLRGELILAPATAPAAEPEAEEPEAEEPEESEEQEIGIEVTDRGSYEEITLTDFGDATHYEVAHLVTEDGHLQAVIAEPETRNEGGGLWNPVKEAELRRQILALAEESEDRPTSVQLDPGRDLAEELA